MISRAVSGLDPRVRLILYILSAVTISLLTTWPTLIAATVAALALLLGVGIAPKRLLKRVLWIAWLALGLCATAYLYPAASAGEAGASLLAPGVDLAGRTALRVLACFLGAVALAETTPLPQLLGAMEALKLPRLFVLLIGLAARYIAVLQQEAQAMTVSRKSRGYRPGRNLWNRNALKSAGQTIGMLLLRAHARSERVYWAMMARGFSLQSQRVAPPALKSGQKWLLAASATLFATIFVLDWQLRGQ